MGVFFLLLDFFIAIVFVFVVFIMYVMKFLEINPLTMLIADFSEFCDIVVDKAGEKKLLCQHKIASAWGRFRNSADQYLSPELRQQIESEIELFRNSSEQEIVSVSVRVSKNASKASKELPKEFRDAIFVLMSTLNSLFREFKISNRIYRFFNWLKSN